MSTPGLVGSLQRVGASLLALLQARLELLGTELREEQARLLGLLAWGAIAFLLLQLGTLFLGLLAVAAWGEERRLLALTVVAALFFAAGALAWWLARRHLRRSDGPFSASLAELGRDREALRDGDP
jgi:uncharacterized membrane protein YqjE